MQKLAFERAGRSSAWLERTVRDREVGGSNPLAPTCRKTSPNPGLRIPVRRSGSAASEVLKKALPVTLSADRSSHPCPDAAPPSTATTSPRTSAVVVIDGKDHYLGRYGSAGEPREDTTA